MRNESLSRRVFSMALVLALAVLAAVLLAQSPLGVVLGSGLFDSPLATPTPARYVGAPLAVGTTPRFEIVQEGGVWHYRVDGTDVAGLQAAATTLNLTNLYPLALGRARNTCDQAGTTFQELEFRQGTWAPWGNVVQETDNHPGFYFCLVSASKFKINPDAISCP